MWNYFFSERETFFDHALHSMHECMTLKSIFDRFNLFLTNFFGLILSGLFKKQYIC